MGSNVASLNSKFGLPTTAAKTSGVLLVNAASCPLILSFKTLIASCI
jgi:hypothetical protein